ncbi:MAG TPA: tetratricopeptide repeat protein, partial [Candidatus Polarisedimenticolia bacterium]|nr:tetratricopeptide repeat protein [Candidatus Polarisedimenticolia bacterium]
EALNGGIVDIWDSTIAGNGGAFSISLVGSDPTLFQVTNSIIDQPQALVYLSNGPVEPRTVEPGWQLAPPGLLGLSAYPTSAVNYRFALGGDALPLVSREGLEVSIEGNLRYRIEPERVLEIHRELGADLERGFVAALLQQRLSAIVRAARYDEMSGARSDDLRIELGKALTELFRASGVVLLSCDVASVRIRHADAGDGIVARRVPGMKVLLVGLDGADWNILDPLIRSGSLPNIARLTGEGTRGRLRTITPMLSPVIWTSMATGVLPGRHGIVDFVASAGREGERVPVTSTLRKVKAFWNILSEQGLSVGVVGWWASYPAEPVSGFVVSDRVAYQLFRAPLRGEQERRGKVYPAGIDEVVAQLTRHPEAITSAELNNFIRGADDALALSPDDQQRIESFKTLLAAGDTYAAAAEALAGRFNPDLTAFYLEGTDTVAHLFMSYAPPPLEGTTADERRRYGGTVDAYYRHADAVLGRLIRASQPTVVILCSDHGFRTGNNRPLTDSRIGYGPAADWHRKYGVIVLHGEPFRRAHHIDEASVIDLTPTLLALFGLPVAEDMDGRPLLDAFRDEFLERYPVRYVPSYEGEGVVRLQERQDATAERATAPAAGAGSTGTGEADGRSEATKPLPASAERGVPADPAGDEALLEKLRSLGYLSQDSANAHNNRGLLLLDRGEFEAAIEEFELAVGAEEDRVMARYNLARAHYLKGDSRQAVEILQALLQRQPDSKEAENLLGNIAMDAGRLQDAERHFRRALELEPRYSDGLNSLGLLYDRQGRSDEALQLFRQVIAIDPAYAEAHNNIGLVLQKAGRLDESIAAFRLAIEADPEFAGSYSNLAVSLERQGDLISAEEQFRQALRRDPDNVRVRVNYGGLLYQQGRLEEAREELQMAVEADPGDASAHNNLGAVYGRLGRSAEEIGSYRRAIALQADYADAVHNLGFALLRAG